MIVVCPKWNTRILHLLCVKWLVSISPTGLQISLYQTLYQPAMHSHNSKLLLIQREGMSIIYCNIIQYEYLRIRHYVTYPIYSWKQYNTVHVDLIRGCNQPLSHTRKTRYVAWISICKYLLLFLPQDSNSTIHLEELKFSFSQGRTITSSIYTVCQRHVYRLRPYSISSCFVLDISQHVLLYIHPIAVVVVFRTCMLHFLFAEGRLIEVLVVWSGYG